MIAQRIRYSILSIQLLLLFALPQAYAVAANGWDASAQSTLSYWVQTFNIPKTSRGSMAIGQKISQTFMAKGERREVLPLSLATPVFGISLSGTVTLHSPTSVMRVLLLSADGTERLVYETYPALVDTNNYTVTNVCEETCFMDATSADSLVIELIDAELNLSSIGHFSSASALRIPLNQAKGQIKSEQNQVRIQALNAQIKAQGWNWTAGETSVSSLNYAQKKSLFGIPEGNIMNLQGAEYYAGGVFETLADPGQPATQQAPPAATPLIGSYDWRGKHAANRADSPYYDGDAVGSGWITAVKNQRSCGSCWAFAATGATEALANLYFNRHLDLDLSEQSALSCSGAGACSGGFPGSTLDYYTTTGAVDEACFPYSATDEPCSNQCGNPAERIYISGRVDFPPPGEPRSDDTLKRMLIQHGPISGGIYSWSHAMTLVGYRTDPDDQRPIWIFKNSWGTNWGENGYGYLKLSITDAGWTHALKNPVTSLQPYETLCVDRDGDGLYNWGIGEEKPAACPSSPPEKDCDDSNAGLGALQADGTCEVLGPGNEFILTILDHPRLSLLFSNENGTFAPPIRVGDYTVASLESMAIADFTGDGLLDFIAGTGGNPGRLYLYQRNASYNFTVKPLGQSTPQPIDPSDYGLALTAADLNNDGHLDFLENLNIGFTGGNWIAKGHAYLNDGTGNFSKIEDAYDFSDIFTGWTLAKSSTLADVDGDGNVDMLASEQASGGAVGSMVYLLLGRGDGTFRAPEPAFTTVNRPATHLTLGDFNNDGHIDSIIGMDDDGDPGAAYLFFGKGDGSFVEPGREVFDVQPERDSGNDQPGSGNLQAFDVNHDGILDIIAAYKLRGVDDPDEGSRLVFIRGLGNGYFASPIITEENIIFRTAFTAPMASSQDLFVLQGADLNHDGCVDMTDFDIILKDIRETSPHDPYFDLNGDGAVNIADSRWLVTKFTNPRGVPCQ
jgi:hypothetical protein